MTSVLSFDIRTVPDVAALRKVYALPEDLSPAEVAEYGYQRSRAMHGHDNLPAYFLQIAAIVCVHASSAPLRTVALASPALDEAQILAQFVSLAEQGSPRLLAWQFAEQAALLRTRALVCGVVMGAPWWPDGCADVTLPAPVSLVECYAGVDSRVIVQADELAAVAQIPVANAMGRNAVWRAWLSESHRSIERSAESSALALYRLYLRTQFIRGRLDESAYRTAVEQVPESSLQA